MSASIVAVKLEDLLQQLLMHSVGAPVRRVRLQESDAEQPSDQPSSVPTRYSISTADQKSSAFTADESASSPMKPTRMI